MRTTDIFTFTAQNGQGEIPGLRVRVDQLPLLIELGEGRRYYQVSMFFEGELVQEMVWTNGTLLTYDEEYEIRTAASACIATVLAMLGQPLTSGWIVRILGENATADVMDRFKTMVLANTAKRQRQWHTIWIKGDIHVTEITLIQHSDMSMEVEEVYTMDGAEIERERRSIDGPASAEVEWITRNLLAEGYRAR